jgi:hypothetical protein
MKIDFRYLSSAYCVTFVLFITYFLKSKNDCVAYWMHDASIEITTEWLIYYCFYLFLLPTFILLILKLIQVKVPIKLFIAHFLFSLASISLLTIAIDKPCEQINGGHYMFINSTLTLGYYSSKLISFIMISTIVVTTLISLKSKDKK